MICILLKKYLRNYEKTPVIREPIHQFNYMYLKLESNLFTTGMCIDVCVFCRRFVGVDRALGIDRCVNGCVGEAEGFF